MIFHQYQRYQSARNITEALRDAPSLKILEVGAGAHGNLAQFLPHDQITFSDVTLPAEVREDPRFVIADATNLPFENDSFDLVIGLDVLEHIPENRRTDALHSMLRVARVAVFITFPYDRPTAHRDDGVLGAQYEALHCQPPVWIGEHQEHCLPTVESCLQDLPATFPRERVISFAMVEAELMKKMLELEALGCRYAKALPYFNAINDYYVQNIAAEDVGAETDRYVKAGVVICKNADPRQVQSRILRQNPRPHLVDELKVEIDRFVNRYLPLLSQADLATQSSDYLLTVLLVTYNQSRFIEETLHSVLAQQADFRFRVLVADDRSTDDTCDKIRAIAAQSSIPIDFVPAESNVGVLKNYRRGFAACLTEFVAVMEGDDLWTDTHRLQEHVDCLRAHPECPMSFNRFLAANYEQGQFSVQPDIKSHDDFAYVFGADIAADNLIGNFSTCVYRLQALRHIEPTLYEQDGYDWLFHMVLAKQGPIAYLSRVMNIYRVHADGTWSRLSLAQRLDSMMEAIRRYDAYTNGIYHEAFESHLARLMSMRMHAVGKNADPQSAKYRVRRVARAVYRCIPPFIPMLGRLLIAPALVQKIASLVSRARGKKNA